MSHYGLYAAETADEFCESPIEKQLLVSYAELLELEGATIRFGVKQGNSGVSLSREFDPLPVRQPASLFHCHQTDIIWIQRPIENYRVDFAVARVCVRDGYEGNNPVGRVLVKTPVVVVECDGHEFHERTKEQAQRDKSRDRDLTSLGYRVTRFAGSEIYADPEKCARELSQLLDSLAVAVART